MLQPTREQPQKWLCQISRVALSSLSPSSKRDGDTPASVPELGGSETPWRQLNQLLATIFSGSSYLPSALHRGHKLCLHHPLPRGSRCWLGPVPEQEGSSNSPGPDSTAERLHGGNTALLIAAPCLVLLPLSENAGIFIYHGTRLRVRSSHTHTSSCSLSFRFVRPRLCGGD